MVSNTVQPFTRVDNRVIKPSLGYDFALLGLSASEARVEKIREAAAKTAERIQQAAGDDESAAELMLSDLASSTYRLLDPRRRAKAIERVQLSILSDSDLEPQKAIRAPFIDPADLRPGRCPTARRR